MNKKFVLLPLTLSAMLLVACGGNKSSSQTGLHTSTQESETPSVVSDSSEEVQISEIGQLIAGSKATVRGTIAATTKGGAIVHDGTGGIYVFASAAASYNVGDYVEVSGGVSSYHDALQFAFNDQTAPVSIKKIEGTAPVVPATVELTAEMLKDMKDTMQDAPTRVQEYSWVGVASKAGTFDTLNMPGVNIDIEPLDVKEGFTMETGKAYKVKGYITGYCTKYSYIMVYLTSLEETELEPASVTVTGPNEVQATATGTYTATVSPFGANPAVTWSTDKPEIATINADGVLTGVAEGTVKVIATSTKEGVAGEKTVTITPTPSSKVESITLNAGEGHGAEGTEITVAATVLPEDASKSLTWTSSDENAATVDAEGKVTLKAYGKVTITAAATDGSGVTATVDLTIDAPTAATAVKTIDEVTEEIGTSTTATPVYLVRGKVVCSAGSYVFIRDKADNYIVVYKSGTGLVAGDICECVATWQYYSSGKMYETKSITSVKKGATLDPTGAAIDFTEPEATVVDKANALNEMDNIGKQITVQDVKILKDGSYMNGSLNGTAKDITIYGTVPAEDAYKWGTLTGYGCGKGKIALVSFVADSETAATSITSDKTAVEVQVEDSETFTVKAAPEKANAAAATAVSSDETKATVTTAADMYGNLVVTVNGVAVGTANVTVSLAGCEDLVVPVTVNKAPESGDVVTKTINTFAKDFVGVASAKDKEEMVLESKGIKVDIKKATSSTDCRYDDADHVRIYKNAACAITVPGAHIQKIVINTPTNDKNYATYLVDAACVWSGATVEKTSDYVVTATASEPAAIVAFVEGKAATRIANIVVTYVVD